MDLEILEALALSDDRGGALAQLLPGSEDHDYYRALHAQQRGALDEAAAVIAAWPGRHGKTGRYDRLRLRQLLHRVTASPDAARVPDDAADQLRDWFGVRHDHEAEVEAIDTARPSRLADAAFDPSALLTQAAERDASLSQVTDEGLAELVEWTVEPSRRRAMLNRLSHTAQPQLVGLVADDLAERGSSGFGSLAVHRALTLEQLHAVAALRPELRGHQEWVAAVVLRMRPPSTVDLDGDLEPRAAYLDELWRFVAELPPSASSLKAHVAWHLLDAARRRATSYPAGVVRAYLALPRTAKYLAPRAIPSRADELVRLGADFSAVTGLAAAGSDEQLIRDILQRGIREAGAAEGYAAWLDRGWLDAEIATGELLFGERDAARATQVLGPARAQALRDRVELVWCAHNPNRICADQPVVLEVDVKNIAELVVKVFRIDPLAYFQLHHREVDTALDLDGLAASHEHVLAIPEPAIRRVRRSIALDACQRPGTYVIDLIGNGISSRAVIHKGRLDHVMRIGAAGHVITIVQAGEPGAAAKPRPDARIWLGDREYLADERGAVIVPFSTSPGRVAMLMTAGELATVAHVELVAERPELAMSFALDHQGLTAGRTVRAIARLALTIGGAPASLALITQARWDLVLRDRQGSATTKSQPLELTDDHAAVLEWPLGDDTAAIELTVTGQLEVRSEQRSHELRTSRSFAVAGMYAGAAITALYLAHTDAGWVVSALGRSGEPLAHRPVAITLEHRWTTLQRGVELATDDRGRVELGPLPDARRITAALGDATHTWALDDPPPPLAVLHAAAGREVIVALPASRSAAGAVRRASLVELRGGAPARHVAATLELLAGAIAIHGLAPGEYELRMPGITPTAIVVVAADVEIAGWAVAASELVQLPRAAPVIAAMSAAEPAGRLTVQLRGADARTRVHVIATRFTPALIEPIGCRPAAPPLRRTARRRGTELVSGRELGDEYRYVLERRAAPRFPGVMLDKPSLLLNPWARRATVTAIAQARPGAAFAQAGAPAMMSAPGGATRGIAGLDDDVAYAGYDFLPAPPVVLANLAVDATGSVSVALAELGAAASVTVIVDDPAGLSSRRIELAEPDLEPRDLRLQLALDPARHATQHKAIAALSAGEPLVIEDLATAQVHLVDSVERAHGYLLALRDDPALRELAFITRWHALAETERRELYSKYACHELHLFLYFKDRAFFDAVIRPYLAHKRTPTFLDHWLLGADVAGYLEPARLAELNAVERALLVSRIADAPAVVRLLDDEIAIQLPAPDRDARLIDALLGAAALDGDAGIGAAQASAKEVVERGQLAEMRSGGVDAAAAMPRGGPPPSPARAKLARTMVASAPTLTRGYGGIGGDLAADLAKRDAAAPMFRAADRTQEWAEANWRQLTPAQSGAAMIGPNRLWRDLARELARDTGDAAARAAHAPGARFLSPWLGLATGSFAEAMCALAVTDLPFVPAAHVIAAEGPRLTIRAAGRALAGSSQLVDGPLVTAGAPLVVGMTYVRADDRHDHIDGEQVDKYAGEVLSVGVVYTCQVVLANPTSSRQRVAALIQIPRGSIAVAGARPTHTIDVALEPYGTHGHEVSFYFPAPGRWTHFPVHVSRGGQIVAAAASRTLDVQAGGAAADPRSWPQLSQRGALGEVVAYFATANLAATDLARVAWRLRDRAGYDAILGALEARRAFDPALWGYALLHRDPPRIRTWLRARGRELLAAGPALAMLGLDAEQLGSYEHLELAPLTNARAHRLGGKLRILNEGLAAQYTRFLELVAHRPAATAADLLAAAHYLLAQDRAAPALAVLARLVRTEPELRSERLAENDVLGGWMKYSLPEVTGELPIVERMQLDYLTGYAACLTGELARAREVATRWRDHPVERWRVRFAALAALLDELAGAAAVAADPRSREQQQAELAAAQPAFDLGVDRDGVVVRSQHVPALELRFFEMDVELLFSRQPFVQSDVSRFSFIEPGHREPVVRPAPEHRVAWPAPLRGKNVVVEAVGAGLRRAKVHYANDLTTNLAHQYGQIRVQRASDLGPLAATYVKVYARKRGGAVEFYKDGYTDLRGWFDYATLSTTELDAVERFAILVCSDRAGAAILEAGPPAR